MGYYNQAPGHQIKDQLTPFEQALQNIPIECWQPTLDILETLIKNIAQNPSEEKYRKIRLSNEKIRTTITSVDAALEALLLMGWEPNEADELILPKSVKLSFPLHVKAILEAKQVLKKAEENDRAARGLSRIAPQQVEKEKAAAKKSAFVFQDRRVKEVAAARADQNLARLRKEKQEQFELDAINQHGQLPQPGNSVQQKEAVVRHDGNTAVTNSAETEEEKRSKVKSAFQFESRAKKEEAVENSKADANDIRAIQKAKYANFKQDPNAFQNQQGFHSGGSNTTTNNNNGSSSSSWWDPTTWFSGGSNPPPDPRGGGNERRGPRIKTMGDMPKPVRRG